MLLTKYYFNFYLLISLAVFHFIDVIVLLPILWTSQVVPVGKNLPASAGDTRDVGSIPSSGRSLEEEMASHSSVLVWKIPWAEEPGRLQSLGPQRDATERLSTHSHIIA